MNPETENVVAPYIENVEKAGREYKEQGRISDDLQSYLESLLVPAEVYVRQTNDAFDAIMGQIGAV